MKVEGSETRKIRKKTEFFTMKQGWGAVFDARNNNKAWNFYNINFDRGLKMELAKRGK